MLAVLGKLSDVVRTQDMRSGLGTAGGVALDSETQGKLPTTNYHVAYVMWRFWGSPDELMESRTYSQVSKKAIVGSYDEKLFSISISIFED